jgi:hypothetical protein
LEEKIDMHESSSTLVSDRNRAAKPSPHSAKVIDNAITTDLDHLSMFKDHG